jgi:hypothetical protein
LTVVLQQADAEAIMKGAANTAQDTSVGTVQLVDLGGKTILWSGTAKDGDKVFLSLNHRGEQKVAANLVGQLKKAMQSR